MAMAQPRPQPSVWVTWVSRLLAGEAQCLWAVWFKAHHTYTRLPSGFDLATWQVEHAALLAAEADRLTADGWMVLREGQNAFRLQGRSGIVLAGRPDLVAVRDGAALVMDCKTGSPRPSHHVQMMIYLLSLPYARKPYSSLPLHGRVVYRGDAVDVPADCVDDGFREHFRTVMSIIGGPAPALRVPSPRECRFCDISADDCAERVDTEPEEPQGAVDLF